MNIEEMKADYDWKEAFGFGCSIRNAFDCRSDGFGIEDVASIIAHDEGYNDGDPWLMVGALIMLMEPALGRTLPMPLIMPWGEWLALVVQLGVLAVVVRHDRKAMGAIHPATIVAALTIVISHCVVEILAITPAWQGLTARVIGA